MGYHITVERDEAGGEYVARNASGAEVAFGDGIGEFSPVELLLAALDLGIVKVGRSNDPVRLPRRAPLDPRGWR